MQDFLGIIREKNPLLYYFGWLCIIMAVLCLVLTKISPTQVGGTSAWWKPFKFWFSTVTLLWAMAYFMHHLRESEVAIHFFSWSIVVLFLIENIWITYKAGLGQLSHYNLSTGFNASMYSIMAIAAAGISLLVAFIGILFLSDKVEPLAPAYLWGIRLGILLFVIFSFQGFSMGARLTHTIGGPDGSVGWPVVNWSKKYGDLRIAHFLGMHALQIIPLMAHFVLKNILWVVGFSVIYGLLTFFVLFQALQGRPLVN